MKEDKIFSCEWLGRPLTIKTGKLAPQATASLTIQYGETVVLATVVESKEEKDTDFFPLLVEFEERLYAAGIIKGSRWIKREGRPTDDAILTGRMIDRSIRPLFNQESRKETQVVLTVLAVDQENDYDIVSLVAASAVLSISGIDWKGPLGGIRVGLVEGQFVFNPTYEERSKSSLDLIVSGSKTKTLMIEAGANEIPEDLMFEAIKLGQEKMQPAIDLIEKIQKDLDVKIKTTNKKEEYSDEEKNAFSLAENWLNNNIKEILFDKVYYTKNQRKLAVIAIKEKLTEYLSEKIIEKDLIKKAVYKLAEPMIEAEVTRAILEEKKRVDGRALNEVRTILSETGLFARTHGSSLFSRGETQVMSIVTLGAPSNEQSLEGMEGQSKKRYMHHYNFPAYCVGEAKPNRGTGRREIGHGALAEKAILPMIPNQEDFPYTIRVVSETLSSNGSSSMGSTCASSLALMDAGVPLKKAVAGVAIGLASNHDMSQWEVITDIQDLEDGEGGMDFKITGTDSGITAIQLDTKTLGLTSEIIKLTLQRGLEARLKILEVMNKAINEPRKELSKYAPRITTFKIDPDKIREVIGSGGKVINEIIATCEVAIDISDDGQVFVCGTNPEKSEEAVTWIKNIAKKFEVGEIITGKIVRMLDFGIFVQLTPNRDGMVHVSEMAPYRISRPDSFVNIGDVVTVKIKEIDEQNRINLTMKGLAENQALWKDEKGKDTGAGSNFNHNRDDKPKPRFNNRDRR